MYLFYSDVPPTNVRVTLLTSHSVTITWKHPLSSSRVSYYNILYTTQVKYARGGNMTVKGTTVSINNLEEDTKYEITVYAIIDNKISSNNPKVTILTYSDGK